MVIALTRPLFQTLHNNCTKTGTLKTDLERLCRLPFQLTCLSPWTGARLQPTFCIPLLGLFWESGNISDADSRVGPW